MIHVQKLERDFEVLDLHHIPHTENVVADDLSTKDSTWAPIPDGVFERRLQPLIAQPTEPGKGGESSTSKLAVPAATIPWSPPMIVGITRNSVPPGTQDLEAQVSPDTWITKFWTYLKDYILPNDSASMDWIVRLAKRYTLVKGDLYWRGTIGVIMRCIT
jgi:hypothetical protein